LWVVLPRPALSRLRCDLIASYLFFLFVSQPLRAGVYRPAEQSFRLLQTTRQLRFVVELKYAVMFHALRHDVLILLALCLSYILTSCRYRTQPFCLKLHIHLKLLFCFEGRRRIPAKSSCLLSPHTSSSSSPPKHREQLDSNTGQSRMHNSEQSGLETKCGRTNSSSKYDTLQAQSNSSGNRH
jgi:hypothetical protein